MPGTDELRIKAALLKVVGFVPEDGMPPPPTAVLAACLQQLALETGLAERDDPTFNWVDRAGLPVGAVRLLRHFMGNPSGELTDEVLRDRLYCALQGIAEDPAALASVDRKRTVSSDDLLIFSQIYWNLESGGHRKNLPIRSGQKLSSGLQARIKVPGADEDFALLHLKNRAARTPGYSSDGGAYYVRGARIALLVADKVVLGAEGPGLEGSRFQSIGTGRGTEWSIVWPRIDGRRAAETRDEADDASRSLCETPTRLSGRRATGVGQPDALELIVAREADHGDLPAEFAVAISRSGGRDPVRFLSGASLNGSDVVEYAVSRRVEIDGDEYEVHDIAARLCADETVGFLIAGAGEGKSTYLHTLCSALSSRAIVFRWRVSGELDWGSLHRFRDRIAAAHSRADTEELSIVVVGELATKLTRDQEDKLIEVVQCIPSGLAPPHTSMVLAGRPAWLNRIRHRVSTGQTMRLLPLSVAEASQFVDRLVDAHRACCEERGGAWTQARFPHLGQFLSRPDQARIDALQQGPSLVGSLLMVTYGREFVRRLIAEYADLNPADKAAYLLVSLATSSLGSISEDLLASMCPGADIDDASNGSPWQRDLDGMHSARHELIGKLVVEDKSAATPREISRAIGDIIEAAATTPEAVELFLNTARIVDESRSLVPEQQRKTEPQFRAAVRAGVLEHREAWERFEETFGRGPGELLAVAHILHSLLPDKLGSGDGNEYLLARAERVLASAEEAAVAGSPVVARAHFFRVLTNRDARRIRGDVLDDVADFRAVLPVLSHAWADAPVFVHIMSIGLTALRDCDPEDADNDELAAGVLAAWQHLRTAGDPFGPQTYAYSRFVARDLFQWPQDRRLSLWSGAWRLSCELASPDGGLACLIDDDLLKRQKQAAADEASALQTRRRHVLSSSVVDGQTNAEVVLRFAQAFGAGDESARRRVRLVGGQLARGVEPTTRSMALHALALVEANSDQRVAHLRDALTAYEQSIVCRDDWLTRGHFWKEALRELRAAAPEDASTVEPRLAAAGRRFSV